MKAIAEWFPARERGFAGGIYNIGASFGSMLAPPLVAWAILVYNWQTRLRDHRRRWRWSGWRCGSASITRRSSTRAARRRSATTSRPARSRTCDAGGSKPSHRGTCSAAQLLGHRAAALSRRSDLGHADLLGAALPDHRARFDLKQIALFAWLPFLAADLGCLFGGRRSHRWLQRRGVSLINARRWAFTVGALLMMGMVFVGEVESPYAAIALLCLGGFAHQTLSVTVITMSSDLFRRNEVATVAGMAGTCGNLGVLLFSLLIGGLVATVGYTPFFVALGRARPRRRGLALDRRASTASTNRRTA